MTIVAHGHRFENVEDARARLVEIAKVTEELGPSDGRVTETNTIQEAIDAYWARYAERKAQERRAEQEREVQQDERRIAWLVEYPSADDQVERMIVHADAEGKRRKSYYRTELGYLRASVRFRRSGQEIYFAG